MKCPACGTRNNFYHRYCYFCGEKLGAMIDPPDDDRPQDQESGASAGDPSSFAYDDRDTVSEKDTSPAGYIENEDYSKESYFTQENTSVDMPEDYFGYPTGQPAPSPDDSGTEIREDAADSGTDDIDYFGYPPAADADPGQEDRADTAAAIDPVDSGDAIGSQGDRPGDTGAENTEPAEDFRAAGETVASIEEDIAAKISYMEKYMDAYLSGRIGHGLDDIPGAPEKETPVHNDSLDFVHFEEAEADGRQPEPEQRPGPEPKQEPVPETPAAPPPPPPTDEDAGDEIEDADTYDPYEDEDEETSRMIDMLYLEEPPARDASYPRRSRRHTSADDTEEDEPPQDGGDGNIVVKIMISLVIIALMSFAGVVLYNEFLNPNRVPVTSTGDLIVTHILDRDTLDDGTAGQRLTLYVQNGTSATIFGETYPVEDEKVQQFYSDSFLDEQYQIAGEITDDGKQIVPVTAIAYDDNGKSIEHEIVFEITSPSVSLAVFSPEGDTAQVQGDTFTMEVSVQPGAALYINGDDYTDQVGSDGLAVIDIDVPGTEEMPVHIRASLDGYADAEKTITLIPAEAAEAEGLLVLNESIPLSTSDTKAVLTGQVPPGSAIETSLPQSGSPAITDDGSFSLTVQIPARPGYSVCLVRVMADGTQIDQREVIIEKTATFNEYTTGPWEFSPYESYKNDPDLHEGYRFKIPGTVKEIISQGDGMTVCAVDTNPDGTEQLIRVWFWGDFSHSAGSSVTVYGNRWDNEEDVPRILAKYIISS